MLKCLTSLLIQGTYVQNFCHFSFIKNRDGDGTSKWATTNPAPICLRLGHLKMKDGTSLKNKKS